MSQSISIRCTSAIGALILFAGGAAAVEHNYYVHFSSFPVGGSATTSVTVGASNGSEIPRPLAACGIRFESAGGFHWVLPFDPWWPTPAAPATDVYMPSSECGEGGVRVEPVYGYLPHENPEEPDDDDPTAQPNDMAGMFWAEDAKLYWIDGNGKKLVYKNVCGACREGKPNFTIGNSGSSWSQITEQLKSLKLALGGAPDPRTVNTLLSSVEQALQRVSYDLAEVVARRRIFIAGQLETAVRGLEDDAQSRMLKATSQYRECRSYFERGDAKSAVLACDAALTSVALARAALGTAENWFE
jgi:hypothetical protein